MEQLTHLALPKASLVLLWVSPCPSLVSLPDFIHHCSRDMEVFHVARVRTESSRIGHQSQETDGGLLGLPKFLT